MSDTAFIGIILCLMLLFKDMSGKSELYRIREELENLRREIKK